VDVTVAAVEKVQDAVALGLEERRRGEMRGSERGESKEGLEERDEIELRREEDDVVGPREAEPGAAGGKAGGRVFDAAVMRGDGDESGGCGGGGREGDREGGGGLGGW
jgi:hypothetical protein